MCVLFVFFFVQLGERAQEHKALKKKSKSTFVTRLWRGRLWRDEPVVPAARYRKEEKGKESGARVFDFDRVLICKQARMTALQNPHRLST